jgi:DNA-binding FadR family transcriptional regulator
MLDNLDTTSAPPRKLSASELITTLRARIAGGGYGHNERLPSERDLAERFGVARGTLREALKQLEASGYVERRAGSGTYVIYVDEDTPQAVVENTRPLDLVDARFALEPHICRLAVLQATIRDFDRAEQVLYRMETCGNDIEIYAEADEEFHMLLAEITGNAMIKWMMTQVCKVRAHTQWEQVRSLTLDSEMMARYNREHRAILDAIRARDPERAAEMMKAHLGEARQSLMQITQT